MKKFCKKCRKFVRKLTKHSKSGNHRPPFEKICEDCHREIHGITLNPKQNKKYQPGTPRSKRKWN
jgi:hypothetical protein